MKRYQLYYNHPIFGYLYILSVDNLQEFRKKLAKIPPHKYKEYMIYVQEHKRGFSHWLGDIYITIPYFRNVFLDLRTNISIEPNKFNI